MEEDLGVLILVFVGPLVMMAKAGLLGIVEMDKQLGRFRIEQGSDAVLVVASYGTPPEIKIRTRWGQ